MSETKAEGLEIGKLRGLDLSFTLKELLNLYRKKECYDMCYCKKINQVGVLGTDQSRSSQVGNEEEFTVV